LRVSADKALFGPSTDIDLSGNGVQPVLSLGATAVTFPDQVIGTPSPTQSLTITNTGDGDLVISALTIDNSEFAIVGTTTCGLAAVPPSGTCSVDMMFAPHVAGIRVGTLAIASNAPGSPHHASLSGNAIGIADLDVSVSADPSPAHAGKKLTYAITIQNHGPAAAPGVVVTDVIPSSTTFSSLSAPAGVSCTMPAVNATGTVVCNSASVANGASYTITLVVNALSGGKNSIANTVSVSSLLTDPVSANNTATINVTVYGRK
jgi:uncharacterized repeat protein (TIGR01451 family)